jgi:chaperonin GroEL
MVQSKIMFRSVAREKILSGATQWADAVRVTLGPKSKSVQSLNNWSNPTVCNDGVTIAKRTELQASEKIWGRKCCVSRGAHS